MTYKAKTYTADFNPDGTIKHNNEIYSSPSALSIYLKRLDMPNKKGDNGWTSVKYNGITLDTLRGQLADLQAKSELLKKSPNKNETTSSKDSISSSSSSSSTTSSTSSSSSSSTTSATSSIATTSDTTKEGQSGGKKSLSAREKNDLLLAQMKASGEITGQKSYSMKPLTPEELLARDLLLQEQQKILDLKNEEKQQKLEIKKKEKLKKQIELDQKKKIRDKKREEKQILKQLEQDKKRKLIEEQYGTDGRTDYSRKRSRRKAATKYQDANSGSLEFVECKNYRTDMKPGSMNGTSECQPFRIEVGVGAAVMVDLHSHFTKNEVIGYLAGKWDAGKRLITITRAFPGKSMVCSTATHDSNALQEAEMDPVSEVMLKSEVESCGLQVVGWYHSHPTFEPVPSSVDITNQANYQILFHDVASRAVSFFFLSVFRRKKQMFSYFICLQMFLKNMNKM